MRHSESSRIFLLCIFIPSVRRRGELTARIDEETLLFNSRFESGNLGEAYILNSNEYNIFLENDVNNKAFITQWYYFSVRNIKKGIAHFIYHKFAGLKVKFNICNLVKEESLYSCGMKPFVYSVAKQALHNVKWHRSGINISYKKNANAFAKSTNVPVSCASLMHRRIMRMMRVMSMSRTRSTKLSTRSRSNTCLSTKTTQSFSVTSLHTHSQTFNTTYRQLVNRRPILTEWRVLTLCVPRQQATTFTC